METGAQHSVMRAIVMSRQRVSRSVLETSGGITRSVTSVFRSGSPATAMEPSVTAGINQTKPALRIEDQKQVKEEKNKILKWCKNILF